MAEADFDQWFHAPFAERNRGAPTVQLFCFPYAGGAASAYHAFCRALPERVMPYVARLPGRESNRHLPALTDIRDVVEQLTRAIRPELGDAPSLFWGHSLGALVAFEIARLLRGISGPRRLIVSGSEAPQVPRPQRSVPIDELSEERFIELLQSYGGMPQAVLRNSELMALLLPQVRSDFVVLDTYKYAADAPLDCNILCVNGEDDRLVARHAAQAWHKQTRGSFSCHWLPGGHFFINDSRQAFVRLIADAVADEMMKCSMPLSRSG